MFREAGTRLGEEELLLGVVQPSPTVCIAESYLLAVSPSSASLILISVFVFDAFHFFVFFFTYFIILLFIYFIIIIFYLFIFSKILL